MADKSQSFRDVVVWQKAPAIVAAVYRASEAFPKHELFAPASQLRRAASSVPSNFVAGVRQHATPDRLRGCNLAPASADGALHQLVLAHDPGYADPLALPAALEEVSRLLPGDTNGLERDGG